MGAPAPTRAGYSEQLGFTFESSTIHYSLSTIRQVDFEHALDLVDDLGERGELKSPERFVPYLSAGPRIEDPVDVVPLVFVQVVVPEDGMAATYPGYVSVALAANFGDAADDRPFERLVDFQDDVAETVDATRLTNEPELLRVAERVGSGVVYEEMLREASLVDVLVGVPGVPVVGVRSSVRYFQTR